MALSRRAMIKMMGVCVIRPLSTMKGVCVCERETLSVQERVRLPCVCARERMVATCVCARESMRCVCVCEREQDCGVCVREREHDCCGNHALLLNLDRNGSIATAENRSAYLLLPVLAMLRSSHTKLKKPYYPSYHN